MRVLDLFSGTQSLKHTLGAGYHVTSVDNRPGTNPDICADMLTWNYKEHLKPGDFDVVWASPPCTEYSQAKTVGPRDIEGANKLVRRTLAIIKYLQPKAWFMENPQTGQLKNQTFMRKLPFHDVSYCKYGFPYKKQTRIWTNVTGFVGETCHGDCDALVVNPATGLRIHKCSFAGPKRERNVPLAERYSVPPRLIHSLFAAC
jgi:site-specific DNA-cytosine methylase